MSVTRSMFAPELDMEALVHALVAWYRSQNLEVELLPGQSAMLQCRERQAWRKFVGMAMGLHVELNYSNPGLAVTISATKWVDKAVVGGIAVVAMSSGIGLPLAIPAAFGYWQQKKLPDRTFSFIEKVISSQIPLSHRTTSNNTSHGSPLSSTNGHSDPMGAKVTTDANTFPCPACGMSNLVTASFCRGCRTPLESELEVSAFKMKPNKGDSSISGDTNSNKSSQSAYLSASGSGSTVRSMSSADRTVVCSKCGKSVVPGKRFCANCGSPITMDEVNALTKTTAPHAESKKLNEQTVSERTTLSGVIVVIDDSGQRITLPNKREVLIGRRDGTKSHFPDLDLAPYKGETCGVSFEHARLLLQNGQVMLEDLDAPNCTWLGEKQLLQGNPRSLSNGDKVRFGNLSATILIP